MRLFIKTAIPLILFSILPNLACAAPESPYIHLNSWIYSALDKLTGFGFINSGVNGTKPYTRLEAARQVKEAVRNIKKNDPLNPDNTAIPAHTLKVTRELLSRLEKEFQFELAPETSRSSSYINPIQDLRFEYLYREGHVSHIPLGHNLQSDQYSLNYNNNGIEYAENNNLQLTFETEARVGSFLLFDVRPIILYNDTNDEFTVDALTAYTALGLGPMEISFGKQSLWWGQGRHGSLILTNNAEPLTMLRITNPEPRLLPWIFRYLGPFRIDFFVSRLEEERHVPDPSFSGLRLNFKPVPWLEFGFSRAMMFGGEKRPEMDFGDYLGVLSGQNLSADKDTSNQLAAIDFNLQFPFLNNLQLYGEIGGEDEAGGMFTLDGWIVGLFIPKIEPSGRLSLRFEYADLSHTRRPPPPWYQHGVYHSGYTYKGTIMGHHVGSAAWDYFVEAQFFLNDTITLKGSVDYEIRGNDEDELEHHFQGALGAEWLFSKWFKLYFNYQFDQVNNYNFSSNDERDFYLISLGVEFDW